MSDDDFLAESPNEAVFSELQAEVARFTEAFRMADMDAESEGRKRRVRMQMEGAIEKLKTSTDRFSSLFLWRVLEYHDEGIEDGDDDEDEE